MVDLNGNIIEIIPDNQIESNDTLVEAEKR